MGSLAHNVACRSIELQSIMLIVNSNTNHAERFSPMIFSTLPLTDAQGMIVGATRLAKQC